MCGLLCVVGIKDTYFHLQLILLPSGRGPPRRPVINILDDRRLKKSIISIRNSNDNLCGLRAIVTGLAALQVDSILGITLSPNDILYIKKGRKIQKELALKLRAALGSEFDDAVGCTLPNIKKSETILQTRIKVISAKDFNCVIYHGNCTYKRLIYLYLSRENHYDVITSMAGLLGSSYFCQKCDTRYNNKNGHRKCKGKDNSSNVLKTCTVCMQNNHTDEEMNMTLCRECNRYCKTEECRRIHKAHKICEMYFRCVTCGVTQYSKYRLTHQCGVGRCRNCDTICNLIKHRCHMRVLQKKGGKCDDSLCTCKSEDTGGIVVHEKEKKKKPEEERKCAFEIKFGNDLKGLQKVVRKQYLKLSYQLHPDKNLDTSDPEKFKKVSKAYHRLRTKLRMNAVDDEYNGEEEVNGEVAHRILDDLRIMEINVECSSSECEYSRNISSSSSYLPTLERTKNPRCSFTTKYIFYDCESTQDSPEGVHVPNMIVTADFNDERKVFTTRDEFCKWAISTEHRKYTFVAHYGSKSNCIISLPFNTRSIRVSLLFFLCVQEDTIRILYFNIV